MEENNLKRKNIIAIISTLIAVALIGTAIYLIKNNPFSTVSVTPTSTPKYSAYRLSGNSLEKFDLYFVQLENEEKNKIYSPLSIKYALEMLGEGAKGETKKQIDDIVGEYKAKKYTNSKNLSFANAMFIKNSFNVNEEYKNTLSTKYNADIIYDNFENAKTINKWIKNKTLNLIGDILDDETVKQNDFILTNALAIDMEWKNMLQADSTGKMDSINYHVEYPHENYQEYISTIDGNDYPSLKFNNNKMEAKAVEIGASINKYDIVKTLGEDNIRKTVGDAYQKWLKSDEVCPNSEKNVNKYLDEYIKEINSNYKKIDISTDFLFNDNDDVKVFAKDLKEYDGTTLQYVGIMPKTVSLNEYIKNIDAQKINSLINDLKDIKLESFREGVVTKITGYIPLFKFDYELNLMNDLKKLNITNVFDSTKADLSGIAQNAVIGSTSHKANIEFSNHGIKAAAVTVLGGLGADSCGFEYDYDVPVETIDLTFDKPYMFLIRDKSSGEVWFTGTVFEPIKYQK